MLLGAVYSIGPKGDAVVHAVFLVWIEAFSYWIKAFQVWIEVFLVWIEAFQLWIEVFWCARAPGMLAPKLLDFGPFCAVFAQIKYRFGTKLDIQMVATASFFGVRSSN